MRYIISQNLWIDFTFNPPNGSNEKEAEKM